MIVPKLSLFMSPPEGIVKLVEGRDLEGSDTKL